jgi:hypothetical protein
MTVSIEDVIALETLEEKIKAILPASYAETYEDVLPVSMGSAGLRYDIEGRVAWDQIWSTFCDLAMAGGPPHRGTLLSPPSLEEIESSREAYQRNAAEIRRGVTLVTGLPTRDAGPGWIAAQCRNEGMAGWLVRAIVMENILAWHDRETLYLPVGPAFRIEKEIKNVITSVAKTCHYWNGHTPREQQEAIEALFRQASIDSKLVTPPQAADIELAPNAGRLALERIADAITRGPGLTCFTHRYAGWIGVECRNVRAAVWIMRAMAAENVLARREGAVVFLPVPLGTPDQDRLIHTFGHIHHLCIVKRLPE